MAATQAGPSEGSNPEEDWVSPAAMPPPWAVKDPRMCVPWPFWRRVFTALARAEQLAIERLATIERLAGQVAASASTAPSDAPGSVT